MLIPIGVDLVSKAVTVADIDNDYNLTNKRTVSEEEFETLANEIKDPLERFCFRTEHELRVKFGLGNESRILGLSGHNDIAVAQIQVIGAGYTGKLKELCETDELKGNYELSLLSSLETSCKRDLLLLDREESESPVLMCNYDIGVMRTRCDTEALRGLTYFIWVDTPTGYPIPTVVFDGRINRMLFLESNNDSLRFGVNNSDYRVLLSCIEKGTLNWEQMKGELNNLNRLVYPILQYDKLPLLLITLHNISLTLVLPFYLAYKRWYEQSDIRQINFPTHNYWDVEPEKDAEYENALSFFNEEVETIRIKRDNRLFGLDFLGERTKELMLKSTLHEAEIGQTVQIAFIDLSNLYLESRSVYIEETKRSYYISNLTGFDANCFYRAWAVSNPTRLYIAPDNDTDKVVRLTMLVMKFSRVQILINRDEWYQADKQDKLSELLAKFWIEIFGLGENGRASQDVSLSLYFIKENVKPKGEVWLQKVSYLASVQFNSPNTVLVTGDEATTGSIRLRDRAYKSLIKGLIKSTGIEQSKLTDGYSEYGIVENGTKHSKMDYHNVQVTGNTICAVCRNTTHNIVVDRTVTTTIELAHKLRLFNNITLHRNRETRAVEALSDLVDNSLIQFAKDIWANYSYEYQLELLMSINGLGDSQTLKIKEVVPIDIQYELRKRVTDLLISLDS